MGGGFFGWMSSPDWLGDWVLGRLVISLWGCQNPSPRLDKNRAHGSRNFIQCWGWGPEAFLSWINFSVQGFARQGGFGGCSLDPQWAKPRSSTRCFPSVFRGWSGSATAEGTKMLEKTGVFRHFSSRWRDLPLSQAEVRNLKNTVWNTPFGTPWPKPEQGYKKTERWYQKLGAMVQNRNDGTKNRNEVHSPKPPFCVLSKWMRLFNLQLTSLCLRFVFFTYGGGTVSRKPNQIFGRGEA